MKEEWERRHNVNYNIVGRENPQKDHICFKYSSFLLTNSSYQLYLHPHVVLLDSIYVFLLTLYFLCFTNRRINWKNRIKTNWLIIVYNDYIDIYSNSFIKVIIIQRTISKVCDSI